ncbi:MAG: hypothetical protein CMJ11_02480 [Pelagibacterales bacterium]|nr:hypothetical protein [Pelagibacterales bacterium]|tara:strand:+ start:10445 stop:10963 length:519 start_codon:yes stop_codon:yes gene_type:complete
MNKLKIKFNSVTKLDSLKKKSGIISIINQDSEKLSVCKRLDLLKLNACFIDIEYKKLNSNDIIANYKLDIEGEQKCVISLKPVKFLIKENFTINFYDHKKLELSTLEDEFTEPIYNGEVNFSEIAIQMFSSFLDPYPKINNGNISLESVYKDKSLSTKNKNNPFEVLNNLNK